jgi:pimeloyl-ACP methyl ester carboxylesterase
MRNRLLRLCLLSCLLGSLGGLVASCLRPGAPPAPLVAPGNEPPTAWLAGDSTGQQPAIAYWRVGRRRPVVVVVHGGPAVTHTYLRPEWDALAVAATVVYYDQRGTGRSDFATCYSWQAHVADLHRLLQAVAPGQRVVLAGSSWGSMLALLYAYQYPHQVRGLVLTGTFPWPGQGTAAPPCGPGFTPAKRAAARQALRASFRYDTIREHALPSRTKERVRTVVGSFGTPLADAIPSWASAPPVDSLQRISVPVLIWRGDQPSRVPDRGEDFARQLPQATLRTIPGAGHDPWLADPRTFFQRSVAFIQQLAE